MMVPSSPILAAFAVVPFLWVNTSTAQQTVPFRGNIPVAPQGIEVPPLPSAPVEYQTAEGQDIRVVVVTRGLFTRMGNGIPA